MRNYEMMFIVKTNIEESAVKAVVKEFSDIITSLNGKITNTKEMGQRELAYPINKEVSGFYYVFNFEANNDVLNELNRKARINENVIRHMIINLDEE